MNKSLLYSSVFDINLEYEKDKLLSFRTTTENNEYLRQLMATNDRSMSYIISKMIDACRSRNVTDYRDI